MTSEEPGESSASRAAAHFKGNLVGDGQRRREGRGGVRGWILRGGGQGLEGLSLNPYRQSGRAGGDVQSDEPQHHCLAVCL